MPARRVTVKQRRLIFYMPSLNRHAARFLEPRNDLAENIGDITALQSRLRSTAFAEHARPSMAHLSAMMDSVMMVVLVVKAARPGRRAGKGG